MRIEKRSMKRWALLLLIVALAVSCIVLLTSCGECEHQWDEGTITEYATETAVGKKVFKCQLCGELKEEEIPKLAHQHSFTGDYEMTATEHTQTCSCGEKKTEAHDFFEPVRTTEPKCGVAGEDTETCKICGYEKKTPVAALEHEFTKWNVTTPATCAADGEKTRSCTLCGETERETLPKLTIHSLTSTSNKDYYHAAVKVTCTTDGSPEYWTCTVCGKYFADGKGANELTAEQLVIPAPGHTIVHHESKASTCDEAGNNEYWDCSVCHAKFADAQGNTAYAGDPTLPKLGHAMTKTDRVEETCTEPGNIEYYTCSNCHKTYADEAGTTEVTDLVIPAGHKYTWAVSEEDANKCIGTCSRCGNVTEPRDHVFTFTKVDATCEGKAVLTNACDCGTKTVTYEPALGHTWGTGAAGTDGTVTYVCTVCEKVYTTGTHSVIETLAKTDFARTGVSTSDLTLTLGDNADTAIGKTDTKQWTDYDYFFEFTLRYDEYMTAFEVRLRSNANGIGSAGRAAFFNVSAEGLITPAQKSSTDTTKMLVPNDETTPESYQLEGYGWHRLAFRIHETHTVNGTDVTYVNYVTLMVDGVEIGTYVENGTTFTQKQWNRYSVTVADGVETVANTDFNPFFQIYKGKLYNNADLRKFIQLADVTAYAATDWQIPTAPITYNGADFAPMGKIDCTADANAAYPSYAVHNVPYFYYVGKAADVEAPTKTGVTFNGWTTDAAGEQAFTGITAETTGPVVLYPTWLCDHTDIQYVADEADENKCIGTCQTCGKVFEAREHVWEPETVVSNTCNEVGYVEYICACGAEKVVKEAVPALGHFFGTGTVADDGTTVYVCTACGTIYNQPATSVITEIKNQDASRANGNLNDPNFTIGLLGSKADDAIKNTETQKWEDYDFFLEFTLRYDEYMTAFEIRLRSDANSIGPGGRGAFFSVSADGLLSPAQKSSTDTTKILVPNDETTPESYQLEGYGWHRLAFRIHETHTVDESGVVTYVNYVTLMVDGVEIGTYVENGTTFTDKQWNRYSVTVADGVETIANTNFNPYFQIYRGGFFNQTNGAWFIQIADPTSYAGTAPTAVSPIEYVDAVFPKMGKFTGNGFVTPSYAVSEVPYFYYEGKALDLPTPTVDGKVASLFADPELTTPVAITAETTGKVVAYAGEYKVVTVTGLGITYETAGVPVDDTAATKTFDTQGEDLVITLPTIGTLPAGFTANGWYLDGVKIAEADAATATVPASRAAVATAMRVTLSVSKAGKVVAADNVASWGFANKKATLNDGSTPNVSTYELDPNGRGILWTKVYSAADKGSEPTNVLADFNKYNLDDAISIGSVVSGNSGAITYTIRLAATEDALKNKTVLQVAMRIRANSSSEAHSALSVSNTGIVSVGGVKIATLSTELQEFTLVFRPTVVDAENKFTIDAYVDGRLIASNIIIARTNADFSAYKNFNPYVDNSVKGSLILGGFEAYDGIYLD